MGKFILRLKHLGLVIAIASIASPLMAQIEMSSLLLSNQKEKLTSLWRSEFYGEFLQLPLSKDRHWFFRLKALRPLREREHMEFHGGVEMMEDWNDSGLRSFHSSVFTEFHLKTIESMKLVAGARLTQKSSHQWIPKARLGFYGGNEWYGLSQTGDLALKAFFESYYEGFVIEPLNGEARRPLFGSEAQSGGEKYFSLSLKAGGSYEVREVLGSWNLYPLQAEGLWFEDLHRHEGRLYGNLGPRVRWRATRPNPDSGIFQSLSASLFIARSWVSQRDKEELWRSKPENDPYWLSFTLGGEL